MPAAEPSARPARFREPPAFLLALLLSAGVYLGGLALLRWPAAPIAPPREPALFVHYDEADNAGPAARQLADPLVLFTLGPSNFAMRAAAAPATHPPPALQPYPLQPETTAVNASMTRVAAAPALTATPAEALQPARMDALHTLGRAPNPGVPLPARGAQLRIVATLTSQVLPPITWPPALAPAAGDAQWQPASFILLFNAAGLVGEPQLVSSLSLTKGEANPAVEADLRKKLGEYFRRQPLPPGSYTVEIGP